METIRVPRSNREWLYWGDHDPLYGVLSVAGKSRTNANPWTEEEFYQQAISEFETNFQHWNQYGVVRESCVEVGCGAGRMTRCLQSVFSAVHACDISPGMLSMARKNCDPAIVRVYQTDGCRLPLPDQSVTAAYSTIVFQHFDSPDIGLAYFREFYRIMKSGSTFMINLPWHQFPNASLKWPYRLADRFSRAWDRLIQSCQRLMMRMGPAIMNNRIGRRLGEFMGGTSYDFPSLVSELQKMGFRDIEVRCYYVPVEQRVHPFFFGRKP